MARKRLLWQLYPSYLLITLVALVAVTWYVSGELRRLHIEQTALDLEARGRLVEVQVEGRLSAGHGPYLESLCTKLGKGSATRITLVLPDGRVLADSEEEAARMDNHAGRPEILAALSGTVGVSTRYSHTLQQTMMYAAIPVFEEGRLAGAVRTAIAVTDIDKALESIHSRILLAGLLVTILAAAVCLWVSRRLSRPLEDMKRGAERFARGELDRRLPVAGSEEIGGLAEALNEMAVQLDDRIRTVVRQRNEQDAVLSSMVEGVLAVDTEERIMRINRAAAQLLGISPSRAKGRGIQEVVRKADLQRFIAETLESRRATEGDILLLSGDGERFLQAHGSALRDSYGREIGALVVLNDVTRLRRLENLRREFVANVSHELKTPVTAIKASAETLLGGALDEPEGARRFVKIAARQAERLGAIIDDLLALSRIEQGAEEEGILLEKGPILPVIESAMQDCAMSAREKSVDISLFCSEELEARINAPLLGQAMVNLLTNAIKYSEAGGKVAVDAVLFEGKVAIKVRDWGPGIEKEHLGRLFERFYRVDRARSRKLGGTGLGLAIVKHVVQAHGGEVTVNSTVGEGSIFVISIPAD